MLHFLPIPPEAKRCDLRVRDAIRRETVECLARDVRGDEYTPPARFAPPIEQTNEPAELPWHNRD